jgi:adenylate cyclase
VFFFGIGYKSALSSFAFAAAVMFTSSFFDNSKKHPAFFRITRILATTLLLWSGISFFVQLVWVAYAITSSIIAPLVYLFIFSNGIAAIKAGNRAGKFFLAGWAGLIVFTAIYLGVVLEILPANPFTLNGIAIGSVYEAIALSLALAHRVNETRREKEEADRKNLEYQVQLNRSFARFVPTEFLHYLGRDSIIDIRLGDQVQRDMTILFSDIRSFTTLSESETPQETFDFLNSYLKDIGPIIRRNHGFIDKYIGDAVMALFPENPQDAVCAAIEMMQALALFNARRAESGLAPINIGIGIHSGACMLGTIGENDRLETTVISDAVNTASRIESLNKSLGTSILVSENTLAAMNGACTGDFVDLGSHAITRKEEPVRIFTTGKAVFVTA